MQGHTMENYDKSKNWTVYGCRWLQDSVTYYIDGEEFAHVTDPDIMESVNNGTPFYLMLDLMNWPGPSLIRTTSRAINRSTRSTGSEFGTKIPVQVANYGRWLDGGRGRPGGRRRPLHLVSV